MSGIACAAGHGCAPDRDPGQKTGIAAATVEASPRVVASRLIGEGAPSRPLHAVQTLDVGREPRRLLRYSARRGARQRVHLRGGGGSDVEIAGRRVYTQQEVVNEAWFEIEVMNADADRLDCELRFERADTLDMEHFDPKRTVPRHTLDRLPGHAYRISMDRRGFVTMPALELPPEIDRDTDRDLFWSILEDAAWSVVALPAEPVGARARWRITDEDRGRMPGMVGSLSTAIELVSVDGDRLELSVARGFEIPPQAMSMTSAGISGVSRVEFSSKGRAVIDLALLQPVQWQTLTRFVMDGVWIEPDEQYPLRIVGQGQETLAAK